jgi:two-component system, OmpR family, response regulator RegX3
MQAPSSAVRRAICIALVEDEPTQRLMIQTMLESTGFEVRAFADTLALRRDSTHRDVDLILLDWELPNESGLELMRSLRESGQSKKPVIFLTAHPDEQRVVAALDQGADDYILKPPKAAELSARINAVLRRVGGEQATASQDVSPYVLDHTACVLRINEQAVALTQREFELAAHLFRHSGETVSRDSLMIAVWNTSPNVVTRSIDTFISRLRKKLLLDGTHGWKLEALYQRGYRLSRVGESASVEPTDSGPAANARD